MPHSKSWCGDTIDTGRAAASAWPVAGHAFFACASGSAAGVGASPAGSSFGSSGASPAALSTLPALFSFARSSGAAASSGPGGPRAEPTERIERLERRRSSRYPSRSAAAEASVTSLSVAWRCVSSTASAASPRYRPCPSAGAPPPAPCGQSPQGQKHGEHAGQVRCRGKPLAWDIG